VTCVAYHVHRWRHSVICSCANTFLGESRHESRLGQFGPPTLRFGPFVIRAFLLLLVVDANSGHTLERAR
jgi:hypothetical protein